MEEILNILLPVFREFGVQHGALVAVVVFGAWFAVKYARRLMATLEMNPNLQHHIDAIHDERLGCRVERDLAIGGAKLNLRVVAG